MGVHGLWQLLQAAGQPVSLESLEGKVLAVDVSIWLHQTMKGMRDKDGNPLPNAHLQGLFSRICKLLFYRIRPVFVFDGGVPILKKQTMAARRERKAEAERESNEISQKLLQNLIKSQAIRQTFGDMEGSSRHIPKVHKGRSQTNNDMFELPPLAESEMIGLALNSEEWDKDFEMQEQWIKEGLAAISETHPDSEEFRSLPMEIQHEILNELREQKKYHSLSRITKMPEDSTDFSSYQLKKLMKQSKLTNQIQEVRKNMATKTSGDIACNLGEEYHGDEVEARRIVSEDAAHYILIKGLTKKMQQEEADKYEIHNRVKLEKVEKDVDDLMSVGSGDGWVQVKNRPKSGDVISLGSHVKHLYSDSDSDGESLLAQRLHRKRHQKSKSSWSVMNAKKRNVEVPAAHKKAKQIVSDDEAGVVSSGEQHQPVVNCSSEDEGFIEVRVDPSVATEDDLFPASIFETHIDVDGEMASGADSKFYQKTADHTRLDTKQIKDDLIRNKQNISPDILQATVAVHPYKDLEDITVSSKHWDEKRAAFLNPTSVIDDMTIKRKNVLNEILSQLEEKKKHLSDLQADMVADSSMDGGFVKEGLEEQDEISMMAEESEASFVAPSDPKIIIPDKMKQRPNSSMISVTDEASSLSDSDDDLKIAIELSLQTARSREVIFPKTATASLSDLREVPLSSHVIRHKNVEADKFLPRPPEVKEQSSDSDSDGNAFVKVAPELSLAQNSNKITKDNKSGDNDRTNRQEDAGNSCPDKSPDCDVISCNVDGSSGRRASISEQSENQKSRFHPLLTTDDEQGKKLSNKSEGYGIDYERTYHSVNKDELEDVRTRLEGERSALLSEMGRHTRMAASITEQTNIEAQELLRLFGIPFITSPMEAEAQCAHLNTTNQIQGTVTDDSDIWLFGGSHVYKNFFNQNKHVEMYTFESIHKHFGLSREQLINIALLCGSDYTEGIPGVGPVRALEIMAEFPGEGLEGLHSFRKWWDKAKSQITLAHENKVRARLKDVKIIPGFPSQTVVDAYLYPQVDESTEKFTWGTPDLDMLREFAKYKFGWSREKSDQSLLPMIKQLSKRESQSRIHSYFQPQHFIQNSKIKSQRLKDALAKVKNPEKTIEEEDSAEDSIHNNLVEEDEMVDISYKEKIHKKRNVTGNNVADCSSSSKEKVSVPSEKKKLEGKSSKKIVKTMKRKMNVGLTDSEIEREKVDDTERNVVIEREKLQDTEKRKFKTGGTVKTDQNQVGKETVSKSNKQILLTNIQDENSTKVKGHRVEFVGEENERKEEVLFVSKLSHGPQKVNERSQVVQNTNVDLEKGRTERGGRRNTLRGRGKKFVSLDHKRRSRGQDFDSRSGGPRIGRGAQNLSASSNSSDDTDSSNENEQSKVNSCRPPKTQARQRHNSKHNLSTAAYKDADRQATCLGTRIHDRVVETQFSESKHEPTKDVKADQNVQPPLALVSKSQNNVQSATGKKMYQERIHLDHTSDQGPHLIPVQGTRSVQDIRTSGDENLCAEQEHNVDMKKADVSVINKQNLPSTLTYLNRRSKEDQLLLQRLKFKNKNVNVVEKRLEDIEKRSKLEKQTEKRSKLEKTQFEQISQDAAEGISFGDILGSVDVAVIKNFHNKVQKPKIQNKKSPRLDAGQRDTNRQAKIFQDRILQQIGQFGTALVGASSKDELDTSIRQPNLKGYNSHNTSPSLHTILQNKNEEKTSTNNVNKYTIDEDLSQQKELDEKAKFSMPVQDTKTLKSNRSKAFDKPIDDMSDCNSDSGSCKFSKERFLKQMEHIGDSKSVKGHGLLPRQYSGQARGGRAFVGKGKGRGKNRNYLAEVSRDTCSLESKNVSEQEILEYAFVTEDDLGSDFSDSEI